MLRTSEGGALKKGLDDCYFSCITFTAGSPCSVGVCLISHKKA